jgi:hypothetical protein
MTQRGANSAVSAHYPQHWRNGKNAPGKARINPAIILLVASIDFRFTVFS